MTGFLAPSPVTIFIAGPVRGKGRPRFVRATGRTYTPPATASYEAVLRYAAQEAMRGREMFLCPVRISIVADFDIPKSFSKKAAEAARLGYAKPAKKPDWDNIAKLTDALNGIVFKDDAQIIDGQIIKRYSTEPGLSIEVRAA